MMTKESMQALKNTMVRLNNAGQTGNARRVSNLLQNGWAFFPTPTDDDMGMTTNILNECFVEFVPDGIYAFLT